MSVPTEIRLTCDQCEIRSFLNLVFNRYCIDMRWFDPDNFPEKMIADKYDAFGHFALVYKEGKLIGGTRLVKDSEYGFPHEYAVGGCLPAIAGQTDAAVREKLLDITRSEIMEVTKTISTSIKNMITKDLVKAYYWLGIHSGIKAYYMVIDMAFFMLCHKISVPVHPIGTPGFIDGSWSVPGILFTDEIKTELLEKNPEFWDYIKDESNLSGIWRKVVNIG